MKNTAPEMVSASQATLASSSIVIGSSATSRKSCLPNGAMRIAKNSRTTATRRFVNLPR